VEWSKLPKTLQNARHGVREQSFQLERHWACLFLVQSRKSRIGTDEGVMLARFQKFHCRAGAHSMCELFAMTGCSGDILKTRKMTGAEKELELQTGGENVKDIVCHTTAASCGSQI